MADSKKCAKCKKLLGLEQFPLKANTSTHTATCSPCTIKKEANRQAKKIIEKTPNPNLESELSDDGGYDDDNMFNKNLSILPLKEFLTFLGRQKM